jgi:hypothetical protein
MLPRIAPTVPLSTRLGRILCLPIYKSHGSQPPHSRTGATLSAQFLLLPCPPAAPRIAMLWPFRRRNNAGIRAQYSADLLATSRRFASSPSVQLLFYFVVKGSPRLEGMRLYIQRKERQYAPLPLTVWAIVDGFRFGTIRRPSVSTRGPWGAMRFRFRYGCSPVAGVAIHHSVLARERAAAP